MQELLVDFIKEPLALPNSRLVRDDPVETVRAMKRDGSTPMRTLGSLSGPPGTTAAA